MVTKIPNEVYFEEYMAQRELFSSCSSYLNYPPIGHNIPKEHTVNVLNNLLIGGTTHLKADDASYWDLVAWLADYVAAHLSVWKTAFAPKDNLDKALLASLRFNSAYRTKPVSNVSAHQVGFAFDVTSPLLGVKAKHPDPKVRPTWLGWSETPRKSRDVLVSLLNYFDEKGVPFDQVGFGTNHIHIGFGRYARVKGIQLRRSSTQELIGTSSARGEVIHEAGAVYGDEQPKAATYCTHTNNLRELGLTPSQPKKRVLSLGRQDLAAAVIPLLKEHRVSYSCAPEVGERYNSKSFHIPSSSASGTGQPATQPRKLPEMDSFGF